MPPPHLIPRPAPERRRLRSSILPHGGARTSADAGEAAQGGSRPCECAHGCLCVSVFLYICVRAKGCLGGMYSGQQTRRIPLKQVLQVYFLFMRVLNVTGFVWMGRQATYVNCRVYTVQAVSLRNCVLIFEVTFYEGFFFNPLSHHPDKRNWGCQHRLLSLRAHLQH